MRPKIFELIEALAQATHEVGIWISALKSLGVLDMDQIDLDHAGLEAQWTKESSQGV